MIVVGDPETLRQEPQCWKGFVECMELNGLIVEISTDYTTGQLVLRPANPGGTGTEVFEVMQPPEALATSTCHGLVL